MPQLGGPIVVFRLLSIHYPARGRKPDLSAYLQKFCGNDLSIHYPARGRKPGESRCNRPFLLKDFQSITPQGDGNSSLNLNGLMS